MFRKAQRKQVRLKIGFSAPSGAGKTYSSLLVAYGICKDWSKIAVIDTENGSAELYSDLGEYSVCQIAPPFTPKKYIEAIESAEKEGFEVLIIDSLSHAWSGEGGLLDMQDKVARASKSGNSFTAWREITPEHNRLVDAILQSDIDVIVTTRAKSDYVINDSGNGKKEIKKVGLAPVFRDGLEYELTVFFDLTQDHIATTSKDRTRLFDGNPFIPSIKTGEALAVWRNNGAPAPKRDAPISESTSSKNGEDPELPATLEEWQKCRITMTNLAYFGIPMERTTDELKFLSKEIGKAVADFDRKDTANAWGILWEKKQEGYYVAERKDQ